MVISFILFLAIKHIQFKFNSKYSISTTCKYFVSYMNKKETFLKSRDKILNINEMLTVKLNGVVLAFAL